MGSTPKPKDIKTEVSFPLQTSGQYTLGVQTGKSTKEAEKNGSNDVYAGYTKIRKLTPVECERLQGFPDGWTEDISDTQRYKVLGNAVTVNVIQYLGKMILDRFSSSY